MAVAVALAVGGVAVGCGSDDDGNGGGSQAAGAAESPAAGGEDGGAKFVATGSDDEQIEQVLHQIQEDFDDVNGEGYCDKVVAAEQRDIVGFGENFGKGSTCSGVIDKVAQEALDRGVVQKPTKLLFVRVDGDRARARVSNGGRPPEWMPFVRRGGQWKVVESGFDPDPIGKIIKEQERKKAQGG
jgi:hypothetical protein